MTQPVPFADPEVAAAFERFAEPAQSALLRLRALIFAVADANPPVGRIEETLKWGEPAYLTPETRSGTTLRLGVPKSAAHDHALFVHCQTDLTRQFDTQYPGLMDFEGTRAVLLTADAPIPETVLSHCIAMVLTYHLRKRPAGGHETTRRAS